MISISSVATADDAAPTNNEVITTDDFISAELTVPTVIEMELEAYASNAYCWEVELPAIETPCISYTAVDYRISNVYTLLNTGAVERVKQLFLKFHPPNSNSNHTGKLAPPHRVKLMHVLLV